MGTDEEKKEIPVEPKTAEEPECETLEEIQRRQMKQAQKRKRIQLCVVLGCIAIALLVFLLYRKYMEPKMKYAESINVLRDVKAGDLVVFGTYEQDKVEMNGPEDIEWIVLDKEGDRLLLLTKYCLFNQSYHSEFTAVTWEDCSLREELNTTFFQTAFNSYEQNLILETTLKCNGNSVYHVEGGNDTKDKVFLLSDEEVVQYLPTEEACKAEATPQALLDGINISSSYGMSSWWLRTPGADADMAMLVTPRGDISEFGHDVISGSGGVRLAVWIDLSKS